MLRRSILLAWLVAILGIIVPCVASAATTASLETRVRDFELVVPTIIGRSTARTPEKHREKSNAYDEIASGSPLAAEAAPALRFSQTTASSAFSAEGTFAGNTIGGLAGDLRAGAVAAGDVPVSYVNLGGNSLIVNTRSSLALTRAGIPQSSWTLIDATATDAASIQARLIRNGLTVEGTPTLRITGLGRGASSLE